MGKDSKGHGSDAGKGRFGHMTDAQLDKHHQRLKSMKHPTDAHMDRMEDIVSERKLRGISAGQIRTGNKAPDPGALQYSKGAPVVRSTTKNKTY